MMARRLLLAVGWLGGSAALGCYSYQPLTTVEPAPGTSVSLELSDQGRVAVAESVGPGTRRVEGTVVRADNTTWVLSVGSVLGIDGRVTKWSGETVGVSRAYVEVPYERRYSRSRTLLLASSVMVGVAAFIATRHLLGISIPILDGGNGDGGGQGQ